MHAEVNIINKYIDQYRRKGYKDSVIRRKLGKECITVIRINNNKNSDIPFTNSAPCSQCIQYLKQHNIHKINYSLNDGTFHFERVKDLGEGRLSRGSRAIQRDKLLK